MSQLLPILAQNNWQDVPAIPTGLEWMTVASVVVPAVLIAVLIYMGSRNTV